MPKILLFEPIAIATKMITNHANTALMGCIEAGQDFHCNSKGARSSIAPHTTTPINYPSGRLLDLLTKNYPASLLLNLGEINDPRDRLSCLFAVGYDCGGGRG